MGNKDGKNDLQFSDEELRDLERSRENRSRFTPDGRARERTHKKGLRIPADVVPRRGDRALEGSNPQAGEASNPSVAAPERPSGELEPAGARTVRISSERPSPKPVMDVAGRRAGGRPPSSRTLPMMIPLKPGQILDGTSPPAAPRSETPREPADSAVTTRPLPVTPPPAPAARTIESKPPPLFDGTPPPDRDASPPAALLWPPAESTDPEDAVTEVNPPRRPAELDTEPLPLEALERAGSLPPPPPPEAVRSLPPGESVTEIAEPAAARPATTALDDDLDADTVEMPAAAVQKAVQMALEAASAAPSQALARKDFDLDQPTAPGASQALEELSKELSGQSSAGEEPEQDRANRVAILLSALRPTVPAEPGPSGTAAEGLEPVPSGELTEADEFAEAGWAAHVNQSGLAVPLEDSPAGKTQPMQRPPMPMGSDSEEELSGEELEEVATDSGIEAEAPVPPPIPDAPASPFEADVVEEPAVVAVKVPVAEPPVEDDSIMTSAPPDIPPSVAAPPPPPDAAAEPEELEADEVQEPTPPAPPQPPPEKVAPPQPPPDKAAPAPAAAAAPTRGRKRKRAWFEEIFDEDWLRTTRPRTADQMRKEIEFLEESLQPSKESQLLDLGCGDGRHALELAARGYQVTGYDLSLPLLIRAADEAQRRDLHVNFMHGDFRDLKVVEQFDAVFCLFTSFGYFDDDTNRKMIQAVATSLRVGGRFLLDVVNRDYIIHDLPARIWWEGTGCVILEEVDFNYFTSRLISKRSVVFEDGRHLEQEISVRSYSLHELGKILHHAGFRVLEVSGHMAHRTRFFGNASRSLVLLAEKRGS